MCGRFVQTPIRDADARLFPQLVGDLLSMPASYNLAPTQRAAVVLDRGEGLQLQRLAWGLLPFWAKAKNLQGSTINARIETVATKPAFRSAFKKHRCLIPMAGYYEWSVSPEDGKKDPWFIHAAGPLWAVGLWEDASPTAPFDMQKVGRTSFKMNEPRYAGLIHASLKRHTNLDMTSSVRALGAANISDAFL